MDLETENRLAAMLMEEAQRLQQEAEREGVGVYLRQPKVRGRPNSRFLTATVLGVQQANRAVEVNEMWRAREKELELSRKSLGHDRKRHHTDPSKERSSSRPTSSSNKHKHTEFETYEDDGLKDEDVEKFLQSRAKRGRGAIGSRMDESGPYPICTSSSPEEVFPSRKHLQALRPRIIGPEKPHRELLEKASSSGGVSVKVVDKNSLLKNQRQGQGQLSEDVVSSSDDSSLIQMKKDKNRRHRRRSR